MELHLLCNIEENKFVTDEGVNYKRVVQQPSEGMVACGWPANSTYWCEKRGEHWFVLKDAEELEQKYQELCNGTD